MNFSKKRFIASMFVSFALACATATTPDANAPRIKVEQLPDSGFEATDRAGAVSVAYEMTVHNPTSDELHLRKIEMQTVGRSPYKLRDTPADVDQAIPAGGDATATFTMWRFDRTGRSGIHEQVWVNGTATFESPKGTVRVPFAESFVEP